MHSKGYVHTVFPRGAPNRAVPAAKRPLDRRKDQITAFAIDQILSGKWNTNTIETYGAPPHARLVKAETTYDGIVIHCPCGKTTLVTDPISCMACPEPGCGLIFLTTLRRIVITWAGLDDDTEEKMEIIRRGWFGA